MLVYRTSYFMLWGLFKDPQGQKVYQMEAREKKTDQMYDDIYLLLQ